MRAFTAAHRIGIVIGIVIVIPTLEPIMSATADVLVVDAEGWLPMVRQLRSPHVDERPIGAAIDLVVIHHISLPPGEFSGDSIERLFMGTLDATAHLAFRPLAGVRVSAHFLIRRDGSITQFAACGERAWHAGESRFLERERCNDFSIGIELEGTGDIPYEADQYRALVRLIHGLQRAYPLVWIAGHSDISPGRKTDPGASFDWNLLEAGLGEGRLVRPF
jgi:AmpD protein